MQLKRLVAVAAGTALAVICLGCGQQPAAASASCIVDAGPSSIDGLVAELPGFTVEPICPADMDPYFGRSEVAEQYFEAVAGRVTENGYPVLTYLAAHLDGSGASFVTGYIDAWWKESDLPKPVAVYTEELGGREVHTFNVPMGPRGYYYVDGPTFVIAYIDLDAPPATAADAFTKILANVS